MVSPRFAETSATFVCGTQVARRTNSWAYSDSNSVIASASGHWPALAVGPLPVPRVQLGFAPGTSSLASNCLAAMQISSGTTRGNLRSRPSRCNHMPAFNLGKLGRPFGDDGALAERDLSGLTVE